MNDDTKNGFALTADVMALILEIRDIAITESHYGNIPDPSDAQSVVDWAGKCGLIDKVLSISRDAYMSIYIIVDDKVVIASSPDTQPEHEHMWYRIEFPEVNSVRVQVFAFVPPSQAF